VLSPLDILISMQGPLLITSFRPWRAHQRVNSSDQLIGELIAQRRLPAETVWLDQLPVSFQLAPMRVICEIYRLRPRAVICCGMAENRPYLSLEQQAKGAEKLLHTSLALADLLSGTALCEISHDAGSYVCNHLYYSVLDFIDSANLEIATLFIHIPKLTHENKALISDDLISILAQLSQREDFAV
jgi:pyroglutamyl-peptidase